jgi:hypothetical protein
MEQDKEATAAHQVRKHVPAMGVSLAEDLF